MIDEQYLDDVLCLAFVLQAIVDEHAVDADNDSNDDYGDDDGDDNPFTLT